MPRFFSDDEYESQQDSAVVQTYLDASLSSELPVLPETEGVSNEAYLNDYRNRMPFHYIEDGKEGYYYWQYGATMVIEFEIQDDVAQTAERPPYLVSVRVDGVNVVDPISMIANLGTMALENKEGYYSVEQVNLLVAQILQIATATKATAEALQARTARVEQDLYSLAGPEYLMQRLVEGTNIVITRDVSDPTTPKLKIATTSGAGNLSLIVSSGIGTEDDPFVVTQPAVAPEDILLPQNAQTVVFNSLPPEGIHYYLSDEFYLLVETKSGEHLIPFSVTGVGFSSLEEGRIKNGFYQLAGGMMFDSYNVNQIPYFGPTEGNYYEVDENKPFMFMRGSNQSIVVNEEPFTQVVVADVAHAGQELLIDFEELPSACPVTAVYDTSVTPHRLVISFGRLPATYIGDDVLPVVDETLSVTTEQTSLEEGDPDSWVE